MMMSASLPLGKLVLRHRSCRCRSRREWRPCRPLQWEQRVDDALARDERTADGLPRGHGTGRAGWSHFCARQTVFSSPEAVVILQMGSVTVYWPFSAAQVTTPEISGGTMLLWVMMLVSGQVAMTVPPETLSPGLTVTVTSHLRAISRAVHMDARGDERAVFGRYP